MYTRDLIGDFKILEQIGEGSTSKVYRAELLSEQGTPVPRQQFAIKIIPKKILEEYSFLKKSHQTEVAIMNQIKHKHLMHLYEYYKTQNNYYMIMDYCESSDLQTFMKKHHLKYFREKEAIEILYGIVKGFKKLREYDIVHQDLKLANIFLNKNRVVIGDFGISAVAKDF